MLLQGDVILFGLTLMELLIFILLIIVIALLIETIFLKIALSLFKSKHNDFGEVFITALIMALVGWIPCLGCILCWIVINSRHDTGFGTAILVWLIAGLIGVIVAFFIAIAILGAMGIIVTILP